LLALGCIENNFASEAGSLNISRRLSIDRVRDFSLIILAGAAAVLLGCTDSASVEYASDNSGGVLHYISTDPTEIFRNKVDHEAALEARGVEPPVGNASWHEFWMKMIAYCAGPDGVGTQKEVRAYIVQQRRALGLMPL
jgi:hypothetical protein